MVVINLDLTFLSGTRRFYAYFDVLPNSYSDENKERLKVT